MTRILAASFLLVLLTAAAAWAQPPEHYLDFARKLYDDGDYYRAVTEAKRYLFLAPDGSGRTEALDLLARSHYEAGQYDEARDYFAQVAAQDEKPDLAAEAFIYIGRSLEMSGDETGAEEYYRRLAEEEKLPPGRADEIHGQALYRLGWLLLGQGRWAEASSVFAAVDSGSPLAEPSLDLSRLALEGESLPQKSPSTAGALSAILPGAGQLYVGRPTDAALAFGLNAAFIWGAVEAAESEKWGLFGLVGLMEVAWYGGNIYNAVNGAHIHNREQRDEFIRGLKQKHGWRLGYSIRQSGPVLSYRVEF